MRIDSENLDELAAVVAQRTGRSMSDCEANPWFGKVKTVGDLVDFVVHQDEANGMVVLDIAWAQR